ncbi:MAG: tRNA 2-selenouridine(34) synthase MnmH [Pseudomonadota bacterium]
MPVTLDSLAALPDLRFDAILDVRSPAEFAEDHVPGAQNLPALSNAERARVGTIYTQESPFKARKIGAALVARNVARHLEGPLAGYDGAWQPLVYCWRGGQRSGSVATILGAIGWRVDTLAGGYQSYRRLVADQMHNAPLAHRLVLLDGNTGTAKTALLHRLAALRVQVLDLEGLAAHRGSVFGADPERPQPAQKAFESAVAGALTQLDPAKPVVVEAESARIGGVLVPPSLWAAMRAAPRIRVTASAEARAAYLTRAYRDIVADLSQLRMTLNRLVSFHARADIDVWRAMAEAGAHRDLAYALITAHYDPRYAKWRRKQGQADLAVIDLGDLSDAALEHGARALASAVNIHHGTIMAPEPSI